MAKQKSSGWLDKYQGGGKVQTADTATKVPTKEIKKQENELATYYGPLQFENCQGAGCSKIATTEIANTFGLNYGDLHPQDAWFRKSSVLKNKGKEVWNPSMGSNYSGLRVGDLISLDRPGDTYEKTASKIPGYAMSDNEGNEHVGEIVGKNKQGIPLVKHGSEHGKIYVQPINNIFLSDAAPVTLKYKPKSIYRLAELENAQIKDKKFYTEPKPSIPVSMKVPNRQLTANEKKYIDAINANSGKQQQMFGLSPEEAKMINTLGYGIFHNESNAGNTSLVRPVGGKMLAAELAHAFGRDASASLSDIQFKYDDAMYNKDKSISSVGKRMQNIGVTREGLSDWTHHRDNYNDEVNSISALMSDYLDKFKSDPKYKYDAKKKTIFGDIPVDKALINIYHFGPNATKEKFLRKANSYSDKALKYANELSYTPETPKNIIMSKNPNASAFMNAAKVTTRENGGWLQKYNDGGPVQENYNDYSVSAPEGFEGDGYSNVGRNYSPAWGGQFQDGGQLITSRKDFSPGILSNVPGLSSLASGNQPGYNRHERYGPLGDLYRYYGGLPLEHNVLMDSQYKPVKSKDKNAKYISLNRDPEFVNEVLENYKRVSSGKLDKGESRLGDDSWQVSGYSSAGKDAHKTTKQGSEHHSNAIGRYILGKGKDEKGEYISYYDKFDQGSGLGINPGELLGLTKPFEIYDRIYIDPKTGKPKMAMGGSLPGAVGFTYARTKGIPSNGPYAKKTMASAQNGMEMKYYQEGLDFQPKTISKNGSVIKDDRGQWAYPGQITQIDSNQITMQGVPYPVLGISDTGDTQMMYPNQEYQYNGSSVTEYPMAQNGALTSLYAGKNPYTFGRNVAVSDKAVTREMPSDPTKLRVITQAEKDAKEAKERRNRINVANAAQDMEFSSPENFAVSTSAIADKLRFSDSPNWFDDNFFNPIPMIGHGASALGRVPLNIKQGNYGKAALDIAAPVAFGAAETLVAPYLEKYVITPATKAIGEGFNFALRKTTPYNNLNEIGRHVLGGVPPERTLERLAGDELRHARIINELGNKRSTGVSDQDRLAYAIKEGLPEEKINKLFPGLQNQTPASAVAPPVPPVPPAPSVISSTNATPTFERLAAEEQVELIRNPELARARGIEIPPEVQNSASPVDPPYTEMYEPISADEIYQPGLDPFEDEMANAFRDVFRRIENRQPVTPASQPSPAGYNTSTPEGIEAMRARMRQWSREMQDQAVDDSANQLPPPPDTIYTDPDDIYPADIMDVNTSGSDEYARLSNEAIAANEALSARRLAGDNQILTDAATAFMIEFNANRANPGSLGSARFPRSWGPAGGIDHNSFMDFYRNSGLTLREIAEGGADTGGDYLQGRYRLYAQDILDPSAPSVQDILNSSSSNISEPLESINLNANPSPFDLNIRGNGNLNKNTVSGTGNSRQMGDPISKTMQDIIPPISEIPQILNNRFANKFQEYPLYKGPIDENLGYLTMGSAGSKKRVADQIENAIKNASESGKVYTGSTSTSHNSYLTQLKQQFKMSKEAGKAYEPQFLGYKYMNSMGNLSDAGYTNKEIAAFLNTEIDQQIKRGVIPKNIQRPYIKNNRVMLPHYGLKKNKYGGTLDYFKQGGQLTKLDQLTNFTNYNTKQPGGWLDKYQD